MGISGRAGSRCAGARCALVRSQWVPRQEPRQAHGARSRCLGICSGRSLDRRVPNIEAMRILVTFAVEAEFAPWRKLRTLQPMTVEGIEMFHAQIGRAAVDFVVTGMGMENARRAAELATSVPHTICIAAGFAGSLKTNHKIVDIFVARAVQHIGKSNTISCSLSFYSVPFPY